MMRRAITAAVVAVTFATTGAGAQGLETEGAIDTIVGAEVSEDEIAAASDPVRIVEAIDKAGETASAIRKVTEVTGVEIVHLTDATATGTGGPSEIEAKLRDRAQEVAALRQEIEGNALLYHAINSRQVLMRDVLGLTIGEDRRVVVYAAAKPAG